ncbi:MAG: hypothetical protein OZ913_00490 [Ignavibacteriaceae bacterium]|jgi:hypothetical protein|nr:MAG: hypothetical protein EDM69_04605 [Chlorobiota bacterium]KXK04892.1 MAG: periplasmic repressor CpxP [Chlorobi bacterium OLB4]MBV6397709.1 hypothetical protein [Ignavibacteria bacterium]MCC6885489.1 hypothetical protein [Ignavibacteriales bacterium]MCE7952841.1 hypothetical protein [Chlorobi bacterium CHB7]MDL1886992.1 hypothetical protein [Ignavibacteria bacterium CHB1]MEB2328764.1 hypothetical protein [Ignavibacteriaceae bacterium]OQY79076.1 MAG: hypothetical protein B6D43_00320 [Ign
MINKTFVTASLILLVSLFTTDAAFSQRHRGDRWSDKTPEERATQRVERMKQNLDLSETQASQIYDILLPHFREVEAKRNEMKTERDKRRDEMKSKREELKTKIDAVLTDEQKDKIEKLRSEKMNKERNRMDRKHRMRDW